MTHSKLPELISILTTYVSVFCVRQAVHLSSKVKFICAFQSSHSSDLHRCCHFCIFLVKPTSCHYQEIWTSQRSIFFTSLNRNEAIPNFFLLYWVLLSWITFCNGDLFDWVCFIGKPRWNVKFFPTLYSWWIVTLCPNKAHCDKQFLSTLKMKLRYWCHIITARQKMFNVLSHAMGIWTSEILWCTQQKQSRESNSDGSNHKYHTQR